MYVLDIDKLQEGDVLLTAQKGFISSAIRHATKSNFSHAMLYVGGGSYIHSDGDGVHAGNLQRFLVENTKHTKTLRPKSVENAKSASFYARRQIGTQYALEEALKSRKPKENNITTNKQFCSRLVAQSYARAGLQIVDNINFCTPEDINQSKHFYEVTDVLKKASADDISFARSLNLIDKQTQITNKILSDIRTLTGADIQSFENILNYLIKNPEHDISIVRIVEESGYLTMWEPELRDNAWRYDFELFLSLPLTKDKQIELAENELSMGKERLERFSTTYIELQKSLSYCNLEYIKMQMGLHKNLINQTNRQIEAAKRIQKDFKH